MGFRKAVGNISPCHQSNSVLLMSDLASLIEQHDLRLASEFATKKI